MAQDIISIVLRGDNQLSAVVGAARRDLRGMQESVAGVSRIMGSAADVTRVFGGESSQLAQGMSVVAGAINITTGSLVGLRGALMAALGPKGLLIAAIGGLVGGLVLWRRRTEEAAEAQRKMAAAVVTDALVALGRYKDRQFALAGAIDDTTERIRRQIVVTQAVVQSLGHLSRVTTLTVEQRKEIDDRLERERNALIGLEAQLRRSIKSERDAAAATTERARATAEAQAKRAAALREEQRLQRIAEAGAAVELMRVRVELGEAQVTQLVRALRAYEKILSAEGRVVEAARIRLELSRMQETASAAAAAATLRHAAGTVDLLRVQVDLGEAQTSQLLDALRSYEKILTAENRVVEAARVRLEITRIQGAALAESRRAITDTVDLLRVQVELGEAQKTQLLEALHSYEAMLRFEGRIVDAARVRLEISRIQSAAVAAALRSAADDIDLLRVRVELGEAQTNHLIEALRKYEEMLRAQGRLIDAERVRVEIQRLERAEGEAIRRQRTDALELLRLQVGLGEATTAELKTALRAYEQILIAEKRLIDAARVRVEILRLQPVVLGEWDALMAHMRTGAEQMQNELARIFGGLAPPVLRIVTGVGDAVGKLFTDLVSGAKTLGNAIADFFGNVARTIVNMIAQLLAQAAVAWILSLIIPGFGFRFFFRGLTGLARGGVIPSAQQGAVTRGVTPALLHPGEVVLPLPRGLRPEDLAKAIHGKQEPTELNLQLAIVFDPRQIPPPQEGHTQAVVVADIRRRGPIFQTLRLAGAGAR